VSDVPDKPCLSKGVIGFVSDDEVLGFLEEEGLVPKRSIFERYPELVKPKLEPEPPTPGPGPESEPGPVAPERPYGYEPDLEGPWPPVAGWVNPLDRPLPPPEAAPLEPERKPPPAPMPTIPPCEARASCPAGQVAIGYTLLTANTPLTKRIWRDEDGELVKQPAANPIGGSFAAIEHVGTADAILDTYTNVLRGLKPNQAIIASRLPSPLRPDGQAWQLTIKASPGAGALARSQDTFKLVDGPALGSLDFDIPMALRARLATALALYDDVLLPAWPGFADVALSARASVSSGAKLIGAADPLPTGFHVAAVISDGTRIEAFATLLFDRIALNGFAVVEASRRGAALKRALVDIAAAKGPERLVFEADPIIGDGVEPVRRPFARHPGGILDVERALRDMALSVDEARALKSIWDEALAAARPGLDAAKEKWLAARGVEIARRDKVEVKEGRRRAEREAARFEAGELRDNFMIPLDDGASPTVTEILSDPARYAGARGFSLDEPAPRRGVTFIQPYASPPDPALGKPPGPWLHSFEHGGRYWRLRSLSADVERRRRFNNHIAREEGSR
jgi:hypothetical protein